MSKSERPSKKPTFRRWGLRLLGWVFLILLGVWIQMRFNLTEWVIILENRWFHQEALEVNTFCEEADQERGIFRLEIDARVKFTIEPAYALRVVIPSDFGIINGRDFLPAPTSKPAQNEIRLPMADRHYRDLQQTMVFYVYAISQTGKGPVIVELLDGDQVRQQQTGPELRIPEDC